MSEHDFHTEPTRAQPSPPVTGVFQAGAADDSFIHDPVERLASEFIDRHRRGESPGIEEYARRYPDCADRIRELFPVIAAMEGLRLRKEREQPGSQPALDGAPLERIGDFRIVREIGRGGMGVVYEAEQQSLHRRVALKVLPRQSLSDPKHLQRFHREARTAGGLHHTNIVPVFGVGEEAGLHFYVMQLIDGDSLEKLVRLPAHSEGRGETGLSPADATSTFAGIEAADTEHSQQPSGFGATVAFHGDLGIRDIVRMVAQAADALQYAHERGVLHRDIKPGNLLVDRGGHLWIADFGLAKAMQDDDISKSGQIIGTVRYMSPEQIQGKPDPRSDVYSLGITLYELLTKRPAFVGSDYNELIIRIVRGESKPPQQINPLISHDLETVIMKAMATVPRDRYQSAGEFADDLRAVLDDQPIRARRFSTMELFVRRCKRNKVVATLVAVAAALLIMLPISLAVGYIRVDREKDRAQKVANDATETLERILGHFSSNRDARSRKNTQLALTPLPVSGDTATLLKEFLKFYDQMAQQSADDQKLALQTAKARRNVGDIYLQLGQFDDSIAAYQNSLEQYRRAAEANGLDDELRLAMARVFNGVGSVLLQKGKHPESYQEHQRALAMLEDQDAPSSRPAALRLETAYTHYLMGRRLRPGMGPESMPMLGLLLDDAAPHEDPPWNEHRPPPPFREDSGEQKPAGPRQPGKREPKADGPDGPPYPFEPPPHPPKDEKGERFFGPPKDRKGPPPINGWPKDEKAERWDGPPAPRGRDDFPPPPKGYPRGPKDGPPGKEPRHGPPGGPPPKKEKGLRPQFDPKQFGAPSGGRPAKKAAKKHESERPPGHEPEVHLGKAVAILEQLLNEEAGVPLYRFLLAACLREMTTDHLSERSTDEKETEHKAIEMLRNLVDEDPDAPGFLYELSQAHAEFNVMGDALAPEDFDEAEKRLREGLALGEQLVSAYPNVPTYTSGLVHMHFRMAILFERMLQQHQLERDLELVANVEQQYRLAISRMGSLIRSFPGSKAYPAWQTLFQVKLAKLLMAQTRLDEAQAVLAAAFNNLRPFAQRGSTEQIVHAELVEAYHVIAEVMRRKGDHELVAIAEGESQFWASEPSSRARPIPERFYMPAQGPAQTP